MHWAVKPIRGTRIIKGNDPVYARCWQRANAIAATSTFELALTRQEQPNRQPRAFGTFATGIDGVRSFSIRYHGGPAGTEACTRVQRERNVPNYKPPANA